MMQRGCGANPTRTRMAERLQTKDLELKENAPLKCYTHCLSRGLDGGMYLKY
jgi:hypothetical protein